MKKTYNSFGLNWRGVYMMLLYLHHQNNPSYSHLCEWLPISMKNKITLMNRNINLYYSCNKALTSRVTLF